MNFVKTNLLDWSLTSWITSNGINERNPAMKYFLWRQDLYIRMLWKETYLFHSGGDYKVKLCSIVLNGILKNEVKIRLKKTEGHIW